MKKLIIVVGLPGSGKSLAGRILKNSFNAKVVETGDIIREEVKRRGLEYNTENDKKIRSWFHSGREHIVIKRIWDKLKKSRKKVRVIVGFRCLKEIKLLRRHYKGKIVMISIVSSFRIRSIREMRRKRFGKSETLEYLKERDLSEKRLGLDKLLKRADYTINNSKFSKKQLESRLVKLVKKITKA
jgi:dephospho-CoA kinase